jgi:hypothetical protein
MSEYFPLSKVTKVVTQSDNYFTITLDNGNSLSSCVEFFPDLKKFATPGYNEEESKIVSNGFKNNAPEEDFQAAALILIKKDARSKCYIYEDTTNKKYYLDLQNIKDSDVEEVKRNIALSHTTIDDLKKNWDAVMEAEKNSKNDGGIKLLGDILVKQMKFKISPYVAENPKVKLFGTFLTSSKTSTSSGLSPVIIVVIVIAVMLVLGGGAYYFYNRSTNTTNTTKTTNTSAKTTNIISFGKNKKRRNVK